MTPIYKEARFPAHYRQNQVRQIMDAIYRLRSIAITGLASMGKSNVVRFIVSHPQVRSRYLRERADDTVFVHVDCAGLADGDETEILDEIVAQLGYEGLAAGVPSSSPASGNVRRLLKAQILSLEPGLHLVLVLDYFDGAATKVGRAFFNYLFHLRNIRPQGNLSYIFATRRPLGHLYELHELLDDGCVIGPLDYQDALDSMRRDEERMGCTFSVAQRDRLVACTGGHPGLLKNAAELLGSGKVDASLPIEEMARQFLASGKVDNLCQELWGDLTPAEQGTLLNVARGLPLSRSTDGDCVAFLERNGILVKRQGRREVFGPLFGAFVHDQAGADKPVRITAFPPNRARIETASAEKEVELSPRLFALLLALVEARGQVVSNDALISRVYGDEAAGGVSNAALSQLVKRLRGALNRHVREMIDDPTYTCVETIRSVGYRLD
jgi:DNA-binding winged helix-turn-helix (wHTH) protein